MNGNNNPQDPDFKVNNGVNEYILAEYYPYGNRSVMLAKQIGSTASKGKDSTSLTSEWKYKRWFYRVDKSTENQRLTGKPMNYLDQKCHKLNSSGYDWVKEELGIEIEKEEAEKTHAILGSCAHNPKSKNE